MSISVALKLILLSAYIRDSESIRNEGDNLIRLSADPSIFPTPDQRYWRQTTLGIINGARSCGGPGKVLDWRYEACSGPGICRMIANGAQRRGELTFVPSQNISGGLGVRFNVTGMDFEDRVYDMIIPDSAVIGGQSYTIVTEGSPTKEFKGKTVNFQYIIFRQVDNFLEACIEALHDNV